MIAFMRPRLMLLTLLFVGPLTAQESYRPSRCELLPPPRSAGHLPPRRDRENAMACRPEISRPFFYPFNGPSGTSLTRMGHPGAQNHDHHRSILVRPCQGRGVDFWSENTKARIVQKLWLAYEDGDEESIMASLLGWNNAEGVELIEQELVAASRPRENGEHELGIQITLRPGAGRESVLLEKSNFGLLAVRVAKSVSHHFGGGQ